MDLSIIIPTKDRGEVFNKTLCAAVAAIRQRSAEIIVVNDSRQASPFIPREFSMVRCLNNPGAGVASARNLGARNSSGTILLFLDDDVIISEQSVNHVVDLHTKYPGACFNLNWTYPIDLERSLDKSSFGRFIRRNRLDNFEGWYSDPSWTEHALFRSKSVASFHLSVGRTDFAKTGGYNEGFPYAGFEDYDFPKRLQKAGVEFYIDTRVMVFHNEADKLELDKWLTGQQRRATTRKVAVDMGYTELALRYGVGKRIIFALLLPVLGSLTKTIGMIPNRKSFDGLYSGLLGIILAGRIYRGYSTGHQ